MPKLTFLVNGNKRELSFSPGVSIRDILNTSDVRIRSACRGNGACGLCRVRVDAGIVAPPNLAEQLHLGAELEESGARLACQIRPEGDINVTLLNPAPPSVWRSLPDATYQSAFPLEPRTRSKRHFGVAVDLGTTHISLAFCDFRNGRRISMCYGPNPQAGEGSDILNRLIAADGSTETASKLQHLVLEAIGDGLLDISTREALSLHDVACVAIVGNTAMLTLLAGNDPHSLLDPGRWTSPFQCELPDLCDWRERWNLLPEADIQLIQPLAGFIGSDLIVGLLHARSNEYGGPTLFLDFGTNTEIALWTGEEFFVTSAAGGPAFEGMGVSCGMAADPGAILHIHEPLRGESRYKVIGGLEASGLCGSALVDLLARLRVTGELDEMGRFRDGAPAFQIVDTPFRLTRQDVDMLQRAKAAIGAAFDFLLAQAGLSANALVKVFVAGAFGRDLDIANAIAIGLLPLVPEDKVSLLGNTALNGCHDWLVSFAARDQLRDIRSVCTVLNLSHHAEFEDYFLKHLYLRPAGKSSSGKMSEDKSCAQQDVTFYFKAFIHAAQYLAALLPDADLYRESVEVCTRIFRSSCAAMYSIAGEQIHLDYCSDPGIYSALGDELQSGLQQVLDTSFLAIEEYSLEIGVAEFIFLPVSHQGHLVGILSVGFTNQEQPSHELLDALLGVAGLIGAAFAHKEASTIMDNYRIELEAQVRQRTAELEKSRHSAESANRAKSVFLSNMSHELRTPLNAILGFTQIMEDDSRIPEDQRQNIAIVNRSGNHLLALINDVLEISRIEAGRTEINNEVFDLRYMLQSIQEMIRVRAELKGLSLVVRLSGDLPTCVLGDLHHLRQVLINLLGNAVKYTENGEVKLVVSAECNRPLIGFKVIDTGPGIAPEDQERIFQAFFQTEAGSTKGEGTGLGLSISREFVRLMGGDLTVESTVGQGSAFYFAVPLPPAEAASDAGIGTTSGQHIVGLAAGQPTPRILLAEDRPDNQQVVKQLLKHIGCEVAIAADGRQALDLFQNWHPQLILMDMRMPILDGYEATRAIRKLPSGREIPILALTASAFEEDRVHVLAAGCNEMLSKPIETPRLFEAIGRLLGLTYEYAGSAVSENLTSMDDLLALPIEIRQELAEAAGLLDSEAVQLIVDRLREDYPGEAGLINEFAKEFRFDKIMELYAQS